MKIVVVYNLLVFAGVLSTVVGCSPKYQVRTSPIPCLLVHEHHVNTLHISNVIYRTPTFFLPVAGGHFTQILDERGLDSADPNQIDSVIKDANEYTLSSYDHPSIQAKLDRLALRGILPLDRPVWIIGNKPLTVGWSKDVPAISSKLQVGINFRFGGDVSIYSPLRLVSEQDKNQRLDYLVSIPNVLSTDFSNMSEIIKRTDLPMSLTIVGIFEMLKRSSYQ
jgi:hypothetical protein